MEPVLKSDIFFFISSVGVVVITIILIVASYYLIKILRNVEEMSETLKEGVDDANTSIRNMKNKIETNRFLSFILGKNKKKKHHDKK